MKLLAANGTTVLATTTTGPNGIYSFMTLGAGTYYVKETQPGGYLEGIENSSDLIGAITLGASATSAK